MELAGRFRGLSEEVSEVVRSAHKGHLNLVRLNHVTHKEVASLDVFRSLVMLRIIRQVNGGLVVDS